MLALMTYRATPVSPTGASPCQLMLGRQIKTTLPTLEKNLKPKWPNSRQVRATDSKAKQGYKRAYDRRHGARPLSPLRKGDRVRIKLDDQKTWSAPVSVTGVHNTPRSYMVETDSGTLRRNRRHLQSTPHIAPSDSCSTSEQGTPLTSTATVTHQGVQPETTEPTHVSDSPSVVPPVVSPAANPHASTTRSGRVINRPRRLIESY